jgi:tRNA A37 threonylcarbamoyladenosine synthetase subunit TsaC/SUA5/YrdC
MSDDEARAVFGDRVKVYVEGRSPGGEASTVVDVTGRVVVVLRQGPVTI